MSKRSYKWCSDKVDAIAYACEHGLNYYWFGGKQMWLVCSEEDWNAVLRGDIVIC